MATGSLKTATTSNTDATNTTSFGSYLSSPQGTLTAISMGAQGISNILTSIGNYNNAKHNYTLTVSSAQDLLDQTEQQVEDIKKQWYLQDSANKTFIANSGLMASSFTDVMRDTLLEEESTTENMRSWARKQAQVMIEEARRAKNKAKKGKTGALLGTVLGGIGGAIIGGPAGASIGAGLGSSIGGSAGQLY